MYHSPEGHIFTNVFPSHVSLVPRLSCSLSRGEGREEIVWYTLFAHNTLIISVITRLCVILENIRRYPSWVCTKILKYPKMYWRTYGYAERVAAHTTASDGLLRQSLVKLINGYIIKVAGKQKIGSLTVFFSRCVH